MKDTFPEITSDSPVKPTSPVVKKSPPRFLKYIFLGLAAILLIILVIAGLLAIPLYKVYNDGLKTVALARNVQEVMKTSDIKKTSAAITQTKEQIIILQQDLEGAAWGKSLPFVGVYISDTAHFAAAGKSGLEAAEIMTQAVEPYSDLLGLKNDSAVTTRTAEDRIAQAVETLDKVMPQIDQVAVKMAEVKKETDQVDAARYPETFQGKQVQSRILELKSIVNLASELLNQARPMVKKLPDLLGTKGEAKYMVLFQNDKELRPTGGFITAYAVFRVEKGRIKLETSDDIYKLDDTVTKLVTPPEPISKYLNVYGWRLRDANFSPDFSVSMKTFLDIYAKSSQKRAVSGIIAVDTYALSALMDVLGPIEIYGTKFTTAKVAGCDCPMVIYELLKQAGTPRNYWTDNRKDMIGVLLQSIMRKALDAPSEMNPKIMQAGLDLATQKHLLFFFIDPDVQKGVEAFNYAGRIKSVTTDYLHISDANLGGAKSNLYVKPSVSQNVSITGSGADISLTIEYKYPHAADNCSLERKDGLCLAGIYRDYLRVYLPMGAVIESAEGFENKSKTFEDLGHTVVDGYFTVVPQGLAKIQIKYKVTGNFKAQGLYQSLIQKQPGTEGIHYKVTVNNKLLEFDLTQDKEFSAKL